VNESRPSFGRDIKKVPPESLQRLRLFVARQGGPTVAAKRLGMGMSTLYRLLDGGASEKAVDKLIHRLSELAD
jgi:hypothetical protein